MKHFINRIKCPLTLKFGKKTVKIASGNIKNLNFRLDLFGFEAELEFCISNERSKDPVLDLFLKEDIIAVEIEIDRFFDRGKSETEAINLNGFVTEKRLKEIQRTELKTKPVQHRRYFIKFSDPAKVLWKQHYPTNLYTDKSYKDVISDNTPKEIKTSLKWKYLNDKKEMIFLSLGEYNQSCSFYDYIFWLVDKNSGTLSYDSAKNIYNFSDTKKDDGKPGQMRLNDIKSFENIFPECIRYSSKLMNALAEKPKTENIENKVSVKEVRRDFLLVNPLKKDLASEKKKIKEIMEVQKPELEIEFARYPSITFRPGLFVKLENELFSKQLMQKGKVYRIKEIEVSMKAEKQEVLEDYNAVSNSYEIEYRSRLEEKGESLLDFPEYQSPQYPVEVEALVVSEKGEKPEETFHLFEDKNTSVKSFMVEIPIFKKQKVKLPVSPFFFTGHFWFPVYKGEKLLVSLYNEDALIKRHIEFRDGVQIPQEAQANHVLFGKKDKNQTSLKHHYKDNKPEFQLLRTYETDTEKITLMEGTMILETREKE